MPTDVVPTKLSTSVRRLSGSEAGSRLEWSGPNEIVEEQFKPLLVFTRHKTC
ncbi:hypothetical protein [Streptomyces silvisoli]|uniref:Uncharacterized protein n=1 Tax=Streptomyces silvisoli TaxID=3034235 RepID=A0ABT5ZP06_9ACTN|nr:hypothetical protein [Streptomyces silvisoli]MDF3291532.1 hypothetical protein [Streptomyces silvisoli]